MNKTPTDIKLHSKSRFMEVTFDDATFKLPCEYLRVHSPSAEVMGHGPGQDVLQLNKESVNIISIEPVGQYAVRLIYSDSHNSGLYTWDYLYELGANRVEKWNAYLGKLVDAGEARETQANDHLLAK